MLESSSLYLGGASATCFLTFREALVNQGRYGRILSGWLPKDISENLDTNINDRGNSETNK